MCTFSTPLPSPPKKKGKRGRAADALTHQVFLNIVLDEAVEERAGGEKVRIGMVVRYTPPLPPPSSLPYEEVEEHIQSVMDG